jgi:hypothetical protein
MRRREHAASRGFFYFIVHFSYTQSNKKFTVNGDLGMEFKKNS